MATATSTTYTYSPIPTPPSANAAKLEGFGRKVEGFDPANVSEEGMKEIIEMLYKVSEIVAWVGG